MALKLTKTDLIDAILFNVLSNLLDYQRILTFQSFILEYRMRDKVISIMLTVVLESLDIALQPIDCPINS